jgi:hypothetical protein
MSDHMDRGMLQDRLIDLVHGAGAAPERVELERAIAADPDLVAELAFLRQAHAALARGVAETTLVAIADAPLGVTFGQGLSEFDEDELDALFNEMARFDGLPSIEPTRQSALPTEQEGGN